MIPDGADAVVMVENTQQSGADEIEVLRAVASGENVLAEGEDVTAGEIVLAAGTRLRAQEIGGLMALGITEIQVRKRPRVGILSTGDEVITPGATPLPGQIRDVNSYTLSALVTRFGGEPIRRGIVPDTYEALQDAVRQAHREDDVVIVTAGSSVSARDLTARVMQSLGSPGVLVHGIAIKPGKPTILAVADGKPMIGLPGNPVSAVVLASLTLRPLLGRLLGLRGELPSPFIPAALGTNVASLAGREDFLPVRLEHAPGGLVAHPVFGRSNLIFTLVRADGWVHIPPATTGLNAGADVQVYLY
jgi:molybdopterin molybdotransferase